MDSGCNKLTGKSAHVQRRLLGKRARTHNVHDSVRRNAGG
jgi:hypothetical protein